jgi:hypothetical protein
VGEALEAIGVLQREAEQFIIALQGDFCTTPRTGA